MEEPPNPWGSCFDAAAHNFLANKDEPTIKVCHGVAIANRPGEEGNVIGHAWLEFQHEGMTVAMDCIWLKYLPAAIYREKLQASYVVEYDAEQFMKLWLEHDFPGPWDTEIKKYVKP